MHSDSQDLQTLINNHDTVYILPGSYSNQSWPIDPTNTAIYGPGKGTNDPDGTQVTQALLDAGGDEAFTVPSTVSETLATELEGFTVKGTVKFNATTNRDFALRNLAVLDASETNDSGRGIEILGDAFLYTLENVFVADCDGRGIYAEHDGQAEFRNIRITSCNRNDTDSENALFGSFGGGGGEAVYDGIYVLGGNSAAGTTNIVFDRVFAPSIYGIRSEDAPNHGVHVFRTNGDSKAVSIHGSRIWNAGGDGLKTGSSAAGGQVKGLDVSRVQFNGNSGSDINFAGGTVYSMVGDNYGAGGDKTRNTISLSFGGFENYLTPYFHTVVRNYFRHVYKQQCCRVRSHTPVTPWWNRITHDRITLRTAGRRT